MTDLISICICTYKRPALRDTLLSIAQLDVVPGYETEIVIADNDAEPSAKQLVEDTAKEFNLPVRYVHAPKQNISIARNACLDNARGNLVAFVDDDEIVSKQWLVTLYKHVKSGTADIVFGPVWAVYPDSAPEWMKRLNFHSTFISTPTPTTGYTGNVMMDVTHEGIKGRRFNLGRGQTGGEDTQFFLEANQNGARLDYNPEAEVHEDVAPGRLSLRWMLRVQYRAGVTLGLVQNASLSSLQVLIKSTFTLAKIGVSFLGALVTLPFRATSTRLFIRAVFHSGIFAASFNASEQVLYG